jgi:hypothetical protein
MKLTAPIEDNKSKIVFIKRILELQNLFTDNEIQELKDELSQHIRAIEILQDNEI